MTPIFVRIGEKYLKMDQLSKENFEKINKIWTIKNCEEQR